MKCHDSIQLSTKVWPILTKKITVPLFLFSFVLSPFLFFLLFHLVTHCPIFHLFTGTIPPLAIVFCKIYTPEIILFLKPIDIYLISFLAELRIPVLTPPVLGPLGGEGLNRPPSDFIISKDLDRFCFKNRVNSIVSEHRPT